MYVTHEGVRRVLFVLAYLKLNVPFRMGRRS